jgi:hypothetical protein
VQSTMPESTALFPAIGVPLLGLRREDQWLIAR